MAFTIEEIEKALVTSRPEFPNYHPQLPEDYKKNQDYKIVTDYLTGTSSSLQGLQTDSYTFRLGNLVNLLKSIEHPTPGEKLVMNVFNEPLLKDYLRHTFFSWLHWYTLEHPTVEAFQAILQLLKQEGLSDTDILGFFILQNLSNRISQKDTGIDGTPLKAFLIGIIKSSAKLIVPSQKKIYRYWTTTVWSQLYFRLLDEVNPEFAQQYALLGAQELVPMTINYLVQYNKSSYIPGILLYLQDGSPEGNDNLQNKLSIAILLYDTDPASYSNLVVGLSRQYLAHFHETRGKEKWEQHTSLAEFENTPLYRIEYSAAAFHFLLRGHREEARTTLSRWQQEKVFISYNILAIFHHYLEQEAFPYLQIALVSEASASNAEYFKSVIQLMAAHFEPSQYLSLVWGLTSSKSKPVRELVAMIIFEKDGEAEKKAISLLENKNATSRQTAALILSYISSDTGRTAIISVLNKETNDTARDILLETVADSLPAESSRKLVAEMVQAAEARGKLGKPVESWLDETDLPALFYKEDALNKISIDAKTIRFLLYRMSRIKTMIPDIEAKKVLALLDKERSAPFALSLIKLFLDHGGEPDYKYLMALAAALGDDTVVNKIRITIDHWVEGNRYKMAEHGVSALALQGSDKALRHVEWYSRKYRNKKANVGAAALAALETAATELGITTHELGDRIVPDFSFEGLFRHFTADGEEYRAFIDSNFKIAFFNEDNKKLKSIPAAADAAIKDEFKAIAKEVREITKSQSSRLEYYLIIQRKWVYSAWQRFFLQNPVMFIYATKLLWGVYDSEGNICQIFLCNEDTTLLDSNDDEITLSDDDRIGIVHPSQLNEDELRLWQKKFYDSSISPIFPQLDRKAPDLSDLDLSKSIIRKFEGRRMQDNSVKSTLDKFGWFKGAVGDGGMIESYNLSYTEKKWEAILELEGVGAGYGWGTEEKLGRLCIIDKTKSTDRWFRYPEKETDPRLIPLKEVPAIFLQEMLAAVESIKVKNA